MVSRLVTNFKSPGIILGEQADADEFLLILLDKLHEEWLKVTENSNQASFAGSEDEEIDWLPPGEPKSAQIKNIASKKYAPADETQISNLVYGEIIEYSLTPARKYNAFVSPLPILRLSLNVILLRF